ncbi:hypothetical protein JB92DRAFT_2826748 [Gautieria morchelliformis]|nr:hypothetical protein JB92DRAFT_2826748 [Gautieria morchelliformis]
MLAHRHRQDSAQQGGNRQPHHRRYKNDTGRPILSPTPVTLSFVVLAHFGGRALTKPDHLTRHERTEERNYLISGMGRQTLPRGLGRRGEGPVVSAVANAGHRKPGVPWREGKGPRLP